jgi:hypothetical protein
MRKATMNDYYSPAHQAVEHEQLGELIEQLSNGADPEEFWGGLSLLQHALDAEMIAHEDGEPLQGRLTAAVLAAGADPLRPVDAGWRQESARDMAIRIGHHVAVEMFDTWARKHRPNATGTD